MLAFVQEAAMQLLGLRYTGKGRDSVVNRGGVLCPSTSMTFHYRLRVGGDGMSQ